MTGRDDLRVLRAGICGTDLQIFRRVRPDRAGILGHEGVAERAATADGRRRFVVFNPVDPDDQDSILGHSYDGIFRRHVPGGAERMPRTVPVDPRLPADLAALVEPLGTVLYGWELASSAAPLRSVSVWGGGTSALLVAIVAQLHGCDVELVHRRGERLRFIDGLGVLDGARLRLPGAAPAVAGCDGAFLCLPREGAAAGLTQAVDQVRPGGCIDLFGGFGPGDRHPATGRLDLGMVRRANVCGRPVGSATAEVRTPAGKPVSLTGHRGTAERHLTRAAELLRTHASRFGALITHVVPLAEAGSYLSAMASGSRAPAPPYEYVKVVIDMTLVSAGTRGPDLSTRLADLPVECPV
ncbi:MDR/zinc-dependent alcohol dehydrogenase-like family protein [Actinoplanes teichomyceticus]|uniref:Threonine dehydrogenase-like Zn-dependent dehydrogenase n=1 Tax=Actinoplanes teichomyceticus TaxID=1867 RepID=A0A561WKP9_ACTTI|nr:medium chain dehydrogenase/reductase family protein [Actinoplanes teichomyceticus]TWG24439.1 threonine dehydrogenase-like Zn-dependent dehydrogenase [Actinoplanes teichomyceticus]GIF12710.1 alcohol dehydrogenase [Actinoplanes teichomyceticus]